MKGGVTRQGFTVVELLIVIVVIAILAAIATVAFSGVQERASIASTKSDASMVAKKLKIFQTDSDTLPPSVSASASELPDTKLSGTNQVVNYAVTGTDFKYCILEVKGSSTGAWTVYASQSGIVSSGYGNAPGADCTQPPPELVNGIRCPVITFGIPYPRPGDTANRYRVDVEYNEPTISRITGIDGQYVYIDQGALDRYEFYRNAGVSWNNVLMEIRGSNGLYRNDCRVTWSWPAD